MMFYYMMIERLARKFLWMLPLLLTTLACNAATQWASAHSSTTHLTTLAPSTTTVLSDAACTAILPDILSAATSNDSSGISSLFFDHEAQTVNYLVVYNLNGEELGNRDDLIVPVDVDRQLDSRASHEHIWNYFKALIPAQDRSYVTEFSILSDGRNNILAGVSPKYDNPREWTLKADVVDADNSFSLVYSLLHEYGHLLTLNASQVPPNELIFFHPGNKAFYEQAVATCPQYFTGEGCSNPDSYINEFFNLFWRSSYADWQNIGDTPGHEAEKDLWFDFYKGHEDQFLTSYAATSPEEDIAESWVHFLLSPKPDSTSVANQKILIFYRYPELVVLRQEIINRLCSSLPGR